MRNNSTAPRIIRFGARFSRRGGVDSAAENLVYMHTLCICMPFMFTTAVLKTRVRLLPKFLPLLGFPICGGGQRKECSDDTVSFSAGKLERVDRFSFLGKGVHTSPPLCSRRHLFGTACQYNSSSSFSTAVVIGSDSVGFRVEGARGPYFGGWSVEPVFNPWVVSSAVRPVSALPWHFVP